MMKIPGHVFRALTLMTICFIIIGIILTQRHQDTTYKKAVTQMLPYMHKNRVAFYKQTCMPVISLKSKSTNTDQFGIPIADIIEIRLQDANTNIIYTADITEIQKCPSLTACAAN